MKTGIIFEGGANRAIFSCGVMDAFLDHAIMPDYIIGVSAGAAYGVSYASGQRGRNLEIFRQFADDKRYAGARNLLKRDNRSYFGLKFVYETIPRELLPFDYEAFARYPGEFMAVVTNAETGRAEYMQVNGQSKDMQRDILMASCALPFMFPTIDLNGKPYMDGGIADSIPLKRAMEDGCERIVVVLTREKGYRKGISQMTRLAAKLRKKKYPLLARALFLRHKRYNRTVEWLEQLEAEGKILVIRPEDTNGVSRIEKDAEKLQALYEQGLAQGNEAAEQVKAFFAG